MDEKRKWELLAEFLKLQAEVDVRQTRMNEIKELLLPEMNK